MKRFLPFLFVLISAIIFFVFSASVNASTHLPTPTPAGQQLQQLDQVPDGDWRIDPEVTFIGKNAARSGLLLDFTLENYNWVCVKKAADGQCDNNSNPLTGVWRTTVAFIVVPLLFIVIMVAAILIIVTRGRSITIMRFLPRFVGVLLLIFLSFAILQFFYQFIDVIQGFFLRKSTEFVGGTSCPPKCISQEDLLFVGWEYKDFIGLRRAGGAGDQFAESAFISLLLTKLTALTYYVMVGILILRKIILWLFIIVSPVFPILLLFYPVRNTGKIWIGEFFRWLLYAPLFAIFLKGLVVLWREGIPLFFGDQTSNVRSAAPKIYDTSVNILLGGPKEFVTPANSLNITETFALYVFSLLMLWGVIILPWILLQIFLDYASGISVSESPVIKALITKVNNLKPPGAPTPTPASGGSAISLPFAKKFNYPIPPSGSTGMAREIPIATSEKRITQAQFMPSAQIKAQTLSIVDMQIPSIRDIAKYDTSLISNDKDKQKETIQIREKLERIANPSTSSSSTERTQFSTMREKLIKESSSGNTLATSILTAANATNRKNISTSTQIKNALTQIANPQSTTTAGTTSIINKEKISKMNESLVKAKQEGNSLAASILSVTDRTPAVEIEKLQAKIMDAKAKGEPIATQVADITAKQNQMIPAANRIQTVSQEDYDEVEKLWEENYRNLEVPSGMAGTRSEWIKDDIAKIDNIINQLTSTDQEKVEAGMSEVSGILPFLLVGGFSLNEIVAYLHAKQEAGKKSIAELAGEEEDKIVVKTKKTTSAEGHLAASVSENSNNDDQDESKFENLVSTPVSSTPLSQSSNDLFAISNLKLPKLTDIVQYEVRHLTKDKTELERIEKMREILERLKNPERIESASQRAQFEELQQRLTLESQNGDHAASMILSAVNQLARVASDIDLTLSELKIILTKIVNPESVSTNEDKNYYTRLHEYLENESSTKNNTLATKILKIDSETTDEQMLELKDELLGQKSTSGILTLSQIKSAISDLAIAKKLREIASNISLVSSTQGTIYQDLQIEHEKGNKLAESIITIKNDTPDSDVLKVVNLLAAQANQGDKFANNVLKQASINPAEEIQINKIPIDAVRAVLLKTANPESLESQSDKVFYSKINEDLKNESTQNNNLVAQKIISVTESTTNDQIQNIKNEILNSQDVSEAIRSVLKGLSDYVALNRLRDFALNNNSTSQIRKGDDTKFSVLKNELISQKSKGNKLAESILLINQNTPESEIIELSKKLGKASSEGDLLAKEVLNEVTHKTTLSSANRLQKVTDQDYQEASNLWEKAYKQYFVPQGFTEDDKGRMEWINQEIVDIDDSINLLSSTDQAIKNQGMSKVSSILPFLLLGGYSHDEVLSYLKVKKEAAEKALNAITRDDESKVSIPNKQSNVDQIKTQTATISKAQVVDPNLNESRISNTPSSSNQNLINSLVTDFKIKIPKITDIAKIDLNNHVNDKKLSDEIKNLRLELMKINNSSSIENDNEKISYLNKNNKLVEIIGENNPLAANIINASKYITFADNEINPVDIKNVLMQLSSNSGDDSSEQGKRLNELRNLLYKDQKDNNNKLATALLAVNEKTTIPEINKISEQLKSSINSGDNFAKSTSKLLRRIIFGSSNILYFKEKLIDIANPVLVENVTERKIYSKLHDNLLGLSLNGNNLANTILSVNKDSTNEELVSLYSKISENTDINPVIDQVSAIALHPSSINLSSVKNIEKPTVDDMASVEKLWIENYKVIDIPSVYGSSRIDWLNNEISNIQNIKMDLKSTDSTKREKAMDEISGIMPFFLLGGFSEDDISEYLDVKSKAASVAINDLKSLDENLVSVPSDNNEVKTESKEAEIENKDSN